MQENKIMKIKSTPHNLMDWMEIVVHKLNRKKMQEKYLLFNQEENEGMVDQDKDGLVEFSKTLGCRNLRTKDLDRN